MRMFPGAFVRGDKILVEDLTTEELEDEYLLKSLGIKKCEWEFEAVDLDAAVERALRNQRNYNKSSRDSIRYLYVGDRDLFNRE